MATIEQLLPMKRVCELTSLSKSEIERRIESKAFPARVALSKHPRGRKAFVASEVHEWIQRQIEMRRERSF
ncbi:MAG: AlpA family phage regulatory protein [Alphaproteobacteria bacterium]|nr:MAG: AlpA family phage regulatory protein [Alphaproteobacteria bacterium]